MLIWANIIQMITHFFFFFACTYMQGTELKPGTFLNHPPLILEAAALTDPEAHRLGRAGWPASSRRLPAACLHLPSSGNTFVPPPPTVHVGAGGSNSGLPTEPPL